ncbi:haloalkane dehalogenase [Bradyrhizobium sp. USDA 4503]
MLSADELPKRICQVDGKRMAYVELGEGQPVVFLHGNPASSYIWRNIMPIVAPHGRCIAPDLIGMGDSEKLEGDDPMRYGFLQHRRFVEGFLKAIGATQEVVLVGQDWGGALAMDWASRHRDSVRGIVYFETIVRSRSWSEMDQSVRDMFERLRSSEGETLVLGDNLFVEKSFSERILRRLSDAEWAAYRRPYIDPGEDRRPTLTFPRELPIDGEPHHTAEAVKAYGDWMAINEVPKLFINGDPGAIITGSIRDFCRSWRNQEEVRVKGKHFLQEDSPLEIGEAIADWLKRLPRLDSVGARTSAVRGALRH